MEYYKELRKYVGHKPLILPGAVVIIVNRDGEVLLQHRKDGAWGLPGGLMELGESFIETAKREVFEETGLILGELKLIDIFSGSKYYLKVSNGDELYSVTAVYSTSDYSGDIKFDLSESRDLQFFPLGALPLGLGESYKDHLNAYEKLLEKNVI